MARKWLIFALFASAYFLSYFYRSANAIIAPDLAAELSLDARRLGLMTSLFFAAFALAQLPLGVALDRWGARWVTPGLMLCAVAGSLLFAVADSFAVLAGGRALIGIGMAGVLMGSLKIFSRWFAPQRFATVSSLLVGIGSLGALAAATPLAWLNGSFGWRAVFLLGAALTLLVSIAIVIGARNAPPGEPALPAAAATGRLQDIFANRDFWRIAPFNFFLAGTLLSFQGLWAGPYLFDVYGMGDLQAGNLLLWLGVGATVGYTLSGWLADRLGMAPVLFAAGALFVACQLLLMLQPPPALLGILFTLFGFAGGFNVMLMAHARRLFPLHMTGKAVTAANLFGIGGAFLLQWLLGQIIGRFAGDAAGRYPPQAYFAALLFTASAGLLSLLWYWPLVRRPSAAS